MPYISSYFFILVCGINTQRLASKFHGPALNVIAFLNVLLLLKNVKNRERCLKTNDLKLMLFLCNGAVWDWAVLPSLR
jgi:hypothetical protein